MNGNLAQFGEDLRLHLLKLQVSLNNINGLFAGGTIANPAELESRLDELRATTTGMSGRASNLRQAYSDGTEREAALTPEVVASWVSRRQTAQLHARADLIEQLAVTAVELATLSMFEAERITMTAILARKEAVALQVRRNDRL